MYNSIKYLYPNALPGVDFTLQDDSDGNGPYIKTWNLPSPPPSQQELDAVKQLADNLVLKQDILEQCVNLKIRINAQDSMPDLNINNSQSEANLNILKADYRNL